MSNYRDFIAGISPTILQGVFGERMAGLLDGLLADIAMQGMAEAVESPWLLLPENADDSLLLLGQEANLDRYPTEPLANYRTRVGRAWTDWQTAGDESSIQGQFAAAGYTGAYVQFFPAVGGPRGEAAPYWSQFWVHLLVGTHPITGPGALVGSFSVGDGTLVGATGATAAFVSTISAIANKWKPAHWVCRGFVFDLSGGGTVEIRIL
jgi:hypothetical protein